MASSQANTPPAHDRKPVNRRAVIIAAVWLAALSAYVIAGLPTASFHGDEAMQVHTSRDYVTAFIERAPERLLTSPPYYIDSDAHLRILNGTINRLGIGLSWHLAGFSVDDLPPPPGWDWGMSYDRNVETNHRPPDSLLYAARLPSTLLLCVSIAVLFGIGYVVAGPVVAYSASGLYALHPTILLNGRRAMQEGSMLCFGLLTILMAAIISERRSRGERVSPIYWALLAAMGALALASKHNAAVFAAAALVWITAAELANRRAWRTLLVPLGISGALIVLGFVALSPALWNDPLARLRDLVNVRAELLNIQVVADPNAPTPLSQRAADLLLQPFIAPAVHNEVASWTESASFAAEVASSRATWLSGVHYGWALGLPLTALMLLGIAITARQFRRPAYTGLLVWLVFTTGLLMTNPLPWQRYTLPLLPLAMVFTGIGIRAVGTQLAGRLPAPSERNDAAS